MRAGQSELSGASVAGMLQSNLSELHIKMQHAGMHYLISLWLDFTLA
ncbi:MAG: hypothetical protein N838_34420 [Thiohalocapsa sp. PB-PSB1]|jgi:hypothetical protein|nr:MAG: hypothetical protein N838_34420 [Thiohalocapsa sp. PB-PSB1]